jgi:mannose-1-phosphate guanylyltransferase
LPPVEDAEYYSKLNEVYPQSESISIDYAVMEKSENIYVIPADFGWDDIGTWKALERYIEPDSASNIVKGNAKFYNATNNVVYAGDKKVVLLDVDNVFFIESDEMIVVGKKENLKDLPQYRNK